MITATRRLVAILAADVAGYSRLMGADEEGTHERLKAHLRELVDPKIAEHRGRVVKNTGDGFLAEFPSVVDAVRCAVAVQRGMADREPEEPEERRIRFRIGINLGDVIVEEHDIFGDGVNVAARLEGLAEPGGICVSRVVRDQVRDRLNYRFEEMGEQSVKNIARPVRVYALRSEGTAGTPTAGVSSAASNPPPVAAPRLSIVVLPFANLSNNPEQQYFTDGITEDVTTDLSRIPHMFVISRNTAFAYQGKRVDTKQIGRELGVRYVLEGSVRRLGSRVRFNAQLIDAESDAHLWAERFDRDIDDLFALQDEITSHIASALNLELIAREAARPTEHPDTLDYILRGRAALWKPGTCENYEDAITLFERALALDPRSIDAQSWLVSALTWRMLDGITDTADADIARAEGLVRQALATSPRSPLTHFAKGQLLRAQRRPEEAIPEYEMALAYNRNWVDALAAIGRCKILIGRIDEALQDLGQAIRLSPRDPFVGYWYLRMGEAYLLQARTDEAIDWLEKARNVNPELALYRAYLASAYALKGNIQHAAAELAEARRLDGAGCCTSIASLKTIEDFGVQAIRTAYEATYFAGLRKAGMPEE
jgi:TolB-like protein/class 3 adenylate cyclase/Tfp pilus assembly protein PilF